MISLFDVPGTQHEGVMEVDLTLEASDAPGLPHSQLSLGITHVAPDGTLKTSETDLELQPMSPAYTQLALLEAKYKSGNSGA